MDAKINTNWKVTALAAVTLMSAAVLAPSVVAAADAQLYELTENMRLVGEKVVHRKATSQLMGWAERGTPLCPENLLQGLLTTKAIRQIPDRCSINATGVDNIDTVTGLGPFSGTYTIVVQGDNPFDAAEFVVSSGSFKGRMDFSLALVRGIPLGSVTGKLHPKDTRAVPFTGVFRLPFVMQTGADTFTPALYLTDSFGVVPLAADEFSLGIATVRFDITF